MQIIYRQKEEPYDFSMTISVLDSSTASTKAERNQFPLCDDDWLVAFFGEAKVFLDVSEPADRALKATGTQMDTATSFTPRAMT